MKLKKEHSILPGFAWSFGATVAWLGLLVVLPLSTLVVNSLAIGFEETPYRVVADGKPTGETVYLHDRDLDDKAVAAADADLSGETVRTTIYGEDVLVGRAARRAAIHRKGVQRARPGIAAGYVLDGVLRGARKPLPRRHNRIRARAHRHPRKEGSRLAHRSLLRCPPPSAESRW